MENRETLTKQVKNKCSITWDDEETDKKINDMIDDSEIALNHKLGSTIDYSKKGMERSLFLNYCLYAWNDCVNEFDDDYMSEIHQIRSIYEVKNYEKKKIQ